MYQTKINQAKQYDNQGEHIACEGKLVFLKNKKPPADVYVNNRGYHPIIISETEYIKVGDLVYYCTTNEIEEAKSGQAIDTDVCKKVLALPEHFSDKHLQDIVDGKMKNDDLVMVKCKKIDESYNWNTGKDCYNYNKGETIIHLNQQNHIILLPAKQSLEEAAENWINSVKGLIPVGSKKIAEYAFIAGIKWQQENN